MKKILFAFLFLPAFSFAQESDLPNEKTFSHTHECGVNLFSITQFRTYMSASDKRRNSAAFNYIPGFYYKYHFGKTAFRAGVDYNHHTVISTSDYTENGYQYIIAIRKRDLYLTAGYERSFGNGHFKPFVFADAMMHYDNQSGIHTEYGCFGPIGNVPFSEETFEYGIQAGAGLAYSINPFLSLTLEMQEQGFISVYQDVLNSNSKWVDHGFRFNPVSKLGFAVSF
jgi:hypothetical protein